MFRKEFYATVICDDYCSDDDTILCELHSNARFLQVTIKAAWTFMMVQNGGLMMPVYVIASFQPCVFHDVLYKTGAADNHFSHVYI